MRPPNRRIPNPNYRPKPAGKGKAKRGGLSSRALTFATTGLAGLLIRNLLKKRIAAKR